MNDPKTTVLGTYTKMTSLEVGGGLWRYLLRREWDASLPICTFVMLNPSTADGAKDDPTIRACARWARVLGCGSLEVVNLFAYRATDPRRLAGLALNDAVGRFNDQHIRDACARARVVVAAWGRSEIARERGQEVGDMLVRGGRELVCLGLTKDGSPKHPLARGRHRVAFDAALVRRFR